MRVAVYAISKNEAHFVERFMASCADADCVVVADTGSTDDTAARLSARKAIVHHITIAPWRFDTARDVALALVPPDIDVCISLDLDEVLEPGWRAELECVWTPETTRLRYLYEWGPGVQFFYEKIHARRGYHWHHPCHEYPRPDGRVPEVWAETPRLLVRHLPDPTKSRGQYLDLLKLSIEEDPACPRNAFYYARELTFYGRWDEAEVQLTRYLALPGATWHVERAYAMRLLGRASAHLKRPVEAVEWFERSALQAPGHREPWVDLAQFRHERGEWSQCYHAATQALAITEREPVYTADPKVWGAWPHDLAAFAAYQLGDKANALRHGLEAARLAPDDERIARNLRWYR